MSILTTKALNWSPSAATATSVTPANSAFANSAWSQNIASTSNAIQIESFSVNLGVTTNIEFELDIGIGTAGNEVVISTIRTTGYNNTSGFLVRVLPQILDAIPSGVRVAIRMRKTGTSTTAWNFALGYYNTSDSTNLNQLPLKAAPSAATGVTIATVGSAFGNTSYGELTSGIADMIWIASLAWTEPAGVGGVGEMEIDIATGAAASEVVQTTLRINVTSANGLFYVNLPTELRIPANTRVALRFRKSGTTSGSNWVWSMNYYQYPAKMGKLVINQAVNRASTY